MNDYRAPAEAADLAALAGLLADDTRASFCLALLDGRAWTATELARHAGVAASTASGHLNLLVAGGLLAQERQGRHRYVRLASVGAAELIESLAAWHRPRRRGRPRLARCRPPAAARLWPGRRTCYDHLAGALGVSIAEAMTARGLLDWEQGLALTASGASWLARLDITLPPAARRLPVRSCLDWTERRPHLAGRPAPRCAQHAFSSGWITRVGSGRAVKVTDAGQARFQRHLGIRLASAGVRGAAGPGREATGRSWPAGWPRPPGRRRRGTTCPRLVLVMMTLPW